MLAVWVRYVFSTFFFVVTTWTFFLRQRINFKIILIVWPNYINQVSLSSVQGDALYSTKERSHWVKRQNLALELIIRKQTCNSILLKSISYRYCYCSITNGVFRSHSAALLNFKTNSRSIHALSQIRSTQIVRRPGPLSFTEVPWGSSRRNAEQTRAMNILGDWRREWWARGNFWEGGRKHAFLPLPMIPRVFCFLSLSLSFLSLEAFAVEKGPGL